MADYSTIDLARDARGVATLTLDRPDARIEVGLAIAV